MNPTEHRRRRRAIAIWRMLNPLTRPLAGIAPWWVLLETTGRRSGRPRQTPLAAGPRDSGGMWLIATHGEHADYVANLLSHPAVRVRHQAQWRAGTAAVRDLDEDIIGRFNAYARAALRIAIDPKLIWIEFDQS